MLTVWAPVDARAQVPPDESSVGTTPGANLEELLELGRRLNPGVAAAALDAEAALARVDASGKLPDPMFKTELWDMRAARDTALPQAPGQVEYSVEQTVPLWGKRELELLRYRRRMSPQPRVASAEGSSRKQAAQAGQATRTRT